MKTALAIVCSLLLAWTNTVLAAAPMSSAACATRPCCRGCKTSSCCAAKESTPESQPVSATPVSSFQNQFSPLACEVESWALPEGVAREFSFTSRPPLTTTGSTHLAWNCAWLI